MVVETGGIGADRVLDPQIISSTRWTYPVNDRFLLEGGVTSNVQNQTNRRDPETGLTAVQVLEPSTNYRYGSRALNVGNTGSYAPTDTRLGSVSGERICGLYDLNPAKFGQVNNLITQASHYGDRREIYNGVDINMTARFLRGGGR